MVRMRTRFEFPQFSLSGILALFGDASRMLIGKPEPPGSWYPARRTLSFPAQVTRFFSRIARNGNIIKVASLGAVRSGQV